MKLSLFFFCLFFFLSGFIACSLTPKLPKRHQSKIEQIIWRCARLVHFVFQYSNNIDFVIFKNHIFILKSAEEYKNIQAWAGKQCSHLKKKKSVGEVKLRIRFKYQRKVVQCDIKASYLLSTYHTERKTLEFNFKSRVWTVFEDWVSVLNGKSSSVIHYKANYRLLI